MRYDKDHRSDHVDDRRGQGGGMGMPSAGVLSLVVRLFGFAAGFGLPGIAVFVVGLVCVGGVAMSGLFSGGGVVGGAVSSPASEEMATFSGYVLDDVQSVWTAEFAARGATYRPATLVLFDDWTTSACGYGDAATGPFYCPGDEDVYIDLTFFAALLDRFGVQGNFAQAYVIAHEIGHHVQTVVGDKPRAVEGAQGTSVRIELQADCYAGLWGNKAQGKGLLEAGDVEAALTAAAAIGDDRIQSSAGRRVSPESFTHGTSQQRSRWFTTGFRTGSVEACDTFAAEHL